MDQITGTRQNDVYWYLIALPHWATHSVAASMERQCTGRLGVWAGDSVSLIVFMLTDQLF